MLHCFEVQRWAAGVGLGDTSKTGVDHPRVLIVGLINGEIRQLLVLEITISSAVEQQLAERGVRLKLAEKRALNASSLNRQQTWFVCSSKTWFNRSASQ